MNEMKEIRINDSGVLILDGHRVLSPVIPRSYKDIDNDIVVKGAGHIDGAVYTRKCEIEKGPFTVCGAMFCSVNLHANPQNTENMFFHRAVASNEKIELFDEGVKYFGADINAKGITLKNAVVAANIFATEIVLENCVVLGGVFAGKKLKLTNSVIGTFNAPFAEVYGRIYMLYPSVFTVEPLKVAEGASLVNLTLADWSNLMLGKEEDMFSGSIELNIESDHQVTKLEDNTLWQSYSVAGKVLTADLLDLRKLKNHFILSVGAMQEQLVKTYELGKNANGEDVELNLTVIGNFFRSILSGEIQVQPMNGDVSFEDLKNHYADL